MPNILFCHGFDSYDSDRYDDLIVSIKESLDITNTDRKYKILDIVDLINTGKDKETKPFNDINDLNVIDTSISSNLIYFTYKNNDDIDKLFNAIEYIISSINFDHVIAHSLGCYLVLNILNKALNDISGIDIKAANISKSNSELTKNNSNPEFVQAEKYRIAKETIEKFISVDDKKIKFTFLMPFFQPNSLGSLLKYFPDFVSNWMYVPHLIINSNHSLLNNVSLLDDLFDLNSYSFVNIRHPIHGVKYMIDIIRLFKMIGGCDNQINKIMNYANNNYTKYYSTNGGDETVLPDFSLNLHNIDIKIIYAENEEIVPLNLETINLLCGKKPVADTSTTVTPTTDVYDINSKDPILITCVGKHEAFSKLNDIYVYQGFNNVLKTVLNRKDIISRLK